MIPIADMIAIVAIFYNYYNLYSKKMKTNKILIIAILIATILTGCKTQQRRPKPDKDTTLRISICELTQKTYDAQPQFSTMNISKMTMSLNYGGMQFTFRSSIRIATDSILSISIQPALGIEMYRAEFTPKGFIVYDKLNRCYSENSYEYIKLSWGLDVDYKAIEALFSHKIFTPTTTNPDEICKDFRIKHMADTTSIVSNTPIGKYTQQFDIDINNYRLTMSGLQYENQLVMAITYGMLKTFDKILFPETVQLQTTMTKTDVSATLNIEKIRFNEPLNISPISTTRYKKVGFMDLLKK